MGFVCPSINQDALACPTEEDVAGGVFLPNESRYEFDDDPMHIEKAISFMRMDLRDLLLRARIENRYGADYEKVSNLLIDAITAMTRACVSYLHMDPFNYVKRKGWDRCELNSFEGEVSFQIRKCHAAVEGSADVNEKIYMRMLALETRWFNLYQRLKATRRWLDKQIAIVRGEYYRIAELQRNEPVEKTAEPNETAQSVAENVPAAAAETPSENAAKAAANTEPAPFRAVSPILPARGLSAAQPLTPTEEVTETAAPAQPKQTAPRSEESPAEPVKQEISPEARAILDGLEEIKSCLTPAQYERMRQEAMEVPLPPWLSPIEVEEL